MMDTAEIVYISSLALLKVGLCADGHVEKYCYLAFSLSPDVKAW
jgi:hypothetical protein